MRRGVLYARLSDTRGLTGGIERQVAELRAHAERVGVEIMDELIDEDLSAAKKKRRPAFERLMEGIAADEWDAVVLRSLDRWVRRPVELERIIEVVEHSKVQVFAIHGQIDLRARSGKMLARMMTTVAIDEVDATRERVRDWHAYRAAQGLPAGRPIYGYRRVDKQMVAHPEEARALRDAARRVVEGESLTSVAARLGKGATTLRQILTSPTVAGLRVHQGQVVGDAEWEPILDRVTWERLRRLFADPRRRWNPGPDAHLLTGIASCWKCHHTLNGNPRHYYCRHDGAVRVSKLALEAHVGIKLFARVDRPILTAETAVDDDAVVAGILALEADMEALIGERARREITPAEWKAARTVMLDELERLRALLVAPIRKAWQGRGGELEAGWEDMPLADQRSVLRAWILEVKVKPGTPGRFDGDRAEVLFRD